MEQFNLSNQYAGSIDLDIVTAMSVIAQIQLAARHPGNNGDTKQIAERFAKELQVMVCAIAPENAELIELGWNADCDI
jgi:hypothetical protein